MSEGSSGRRTWAVAEIDLPRTTAEQVCTAFLDVMAEPAPWACIDAWSDYRDELPAEVEHAQTALQQLHAHRDGQDTGMGIGIDRSDPAQEALLRTYAAWSIHVELLSAAEQEALVTFHDGASSITAELTGTEVERLRERLAGVASVERLERLHAQARVRREQERWERRAQRKQQWLARLGWSPQRDVRRQEEELLCAECGHPQGAHPGPGQRDLKVCAVCVYEEDYELREESEMCRRAYPG
ncbi:hypothetical protein [Kineococcus radiotolerans]|uniref:hypothetical protein n=1 Tax=Kineococcus radiotolerans TaxID=131568 RepID=UPI00003A3C07|nr:hypothetical protein [Kineococcus radiotolerans]